MKTLIIGKRVVVNGKIVSPGMVFIQDDVIHEVIEGVKNVDRNEYTNIIECEWVVPGFIDLHTHGIGGAESVSQYWLSDYSAKQFVKYGTTSFLASVTFSKEEEEVTQNVIDSLKERTGKILPGQAVVEGIHAEGPIIRTLGGLPKSSEYTLEDFKKLVDNLLPSLKIMTISPSLELENDFSRFKYLHEKNIVPALGHDMEAKEHEIVTALKYTKECKKTVHITHLYNVSKVHHRDVSLVNFGLLSKYPKLPLYDNIEEPSVEIIGDLIHVNPLAIQLALESKDNNKITFITDAIIDNVEGSKVIYCGRKVILSPSKQVFLEGTETLAGSCANMKQVFDNLVKKMGVPVEKASLMLSENPAKIAKLSHVGSLQSKKRADIIILDDKLEISAVFVAGKKAF